VRITILGNGAFVIDKKHSAAGYLIEYNGKNILVDCGVGVQTQMANIGFDPLTLDYIFITHIHSDHVSDLFALLGRIPVSVKYYGMEFSKNLTLVGPGTEVYIKTLTEIYDSGSVRGFDQLVYGGLEDSYEFDDFSVKTFKVDHIGTDAVAYRFTFGDKVVVFSGDTTYCDGIIRAAKNADLLITDCGIPKGKPTVAHMSTTEVGDLCKKDDVKKVVLSHLLPPGYDVDLISEVREVFEGEVLQAELLMEITL